MGRWKDEGWTGVDHLTPRQKEIYEFIRDKIENRGYPPTVREIGGAFGIKSTNGVMCHLAALAEKGCIERDRGTWRGIRLVAQKMEDETP